MAEKPIQTAWCFHCGVEIRRAQIPPLIWVHNDMGGLRDHDALPDVDEAVRDALGGAVQRVTDDCIANGHYDASHVHYESDYQLCENCKGVIEAILRSSDE